VNSTWQYLSSKRSYSKSRLGYNAFVRSIDNVWLCLCKKI